MEICYEEYWIFTVHCFDNGPNLRAEAEKEHDLVCDHYHKGMIWSSSWNFVPIKICRCD